MIITLFFKKKEKRKGAGIYLFLCSALPAINKLKVASRMQSHCIITWNIATLDNWYFIINGLLIWKYKDITADACSLLNYLKGKDCWEKGNVSTVHHPVV